MTSYNFYSATATASKITGVPAAEIRSNFRKGSKPEGKTLNAVIIAGRLMKGQPIKVAATVPADE